ncbi:DNA repair exonuclease [Limimaricola variabilis]|uniref:metallophosphoesterase family protein n=1 Tax=Limimaricola variabilis TaxID=1492771 RepID=UPI002AC9C1EB|nr:DNA repair exonuclease [Limimaricola variabilis]WPY95278.1 DNA repair exonuclease [Limimaricola variabilis]
MIRFLHSSDLHLGKPFGRFPEDVRVRLRQARQDSLSRLTAIARENAATHILLAGDTFDQTTPAPRVIRHALNEMGAAQDLTWVLMPGNHDHANATELWRTVAQDAPDNLKLALEPKPLDLGNRAVLLPAPPPERHPGRDLTQWFDRAETGDSVRIGLAHGSVTSFGSSEDGGSSTIPPDRATRSGLAYLGLGDWHGQLRVAAETWYSGAPEADSFKHDGATAALLVEIRGDGSPVRTKSIPTGTLNWQRATLDLSESDDVMARHEALLPTLSARPRTLMDLVVTGRARASDRASLERAVQDISHDFLWHVANFDDLGMVHDTEDLDVLDHRGALRAAAESLAREAADPNLPPASRETAQSALSALFAFALET